MKRNFVYVVILDSRYGRMVSGHKTHSEALDYVYDWVVNYWTLSEGIPRDKDKAISEYFEFFEGESYEIYPIGTANSAHKRIEDTLGQAASEIRGNLDTFIQGLLEADGDFGMSFEDTARQNAYDMGRTLGKTEIERLEIGG